MAAGVPIEQVRAMKAQGLDNNQIIQSLQKDGFNSTQIFDAINQATAPADMGTFDPPQEQDPLTSLGALSTQQTGETTMQPTFPPASPGSSTGGAPSTISVPSIGAGSSTEEIVEAIIDEKWNELVKDITTIIEWKNQAQNTITSMEQQFLDLKNQFDKLHQALIAKIGEYDKNILDVGAEIKAMEKVFSKVLPVFTENVAQLSTITKNMKGSKEKEEAHQDYEP